MRGFFSRHCTTSHMRHLRARYRRARRRATTAASMPSTSTAVTEGEEGEGEEGEEWDRRTRQRRNRLSRWCPRAVPSFGQRALVERLLSPMADFIRSSKAGQLMDTDEADCAGRRRGTMRTVSPMRRSTRGCSGRGAASRRTWAPRGRAAGTHGAPPGRPQVGPVALY